MMMIDDAFMVMCFIHLYELQNGLVERTLPERHRISPRYNVDDCVVVDHKQSQQHIWKKKMRFLSQLKLDEIGLVVRRRIVEKRILQPKRLGGIGHVVDDHIVHHIVLKHISSPQKTLDGIEGH